MALPVAELARQHEPPWDFARDLKPEGRQLDGLQHFLILADILLPSVWRARPPPAPNQKLRAAGLRVSLAGVRQAYDETCPIFTETNTQMWKGTEWANHFNRDLASKDKGKMAEMLRQGLHGIIVA